MAYLVTDPENGKFVIVRDDPGPAFAGPVEECEVGDEGLDCGEGTEAGNGGWGVIGVSPEGLKAFRSLAAMQRAKCAFRGPWEVVMNFPTWDDYLKIRKL